MGRLYDRQDLNFNLNFWNRQEQILHAQIANGEMAASTLDVVIHEPARGAEGRGRCYTVREGFELNRKRERMKLLRTGMLLRDLERARKDFKLCPRCYVDAAGKDRACRAHREALTKAKSAVYWAGERNLAEREQRGQRREERNLDTLTLTASDASLLKALGISEGLVDSSLHVGDVWVETTHALNKWEKLHALDKREGNWPRDAEMYDVAPTYEGYLEVLLFEEEMTRVEFDAEMARLRTEREACVENARTFAGSNGAKVTRSNRTPATLSGFTGLT